MTSDPEDARRAALRTLRRAPERTAVLLDFDGTLSPIVEDPEAAVPLPGAADALVRLTERFGVVAVVSGRPASYLQHHLPPGPGLVGLYGLERVEGGSIVPHPDAARWRSVVADLVTEAGSELPDGVGIEDKGLSLTLHVRPHPELAEVAWRWAAAAAERSGLHVRRARMSAELHPPVGADKGTITTELIAGMDAACFIGDDVGDLPAFTALTRFPGDSVRAVVTSAEATPELLAAADVLLDGPPAVLDFLSALLR